MRVYRYQPGVALLIFLPIIMVVAQSVVIWEQDCLGVVGLTPIPGGEHVVCEEAPTVTLTNTATALPTATNTPIPPTATNTPVPSTATATVPPSPIAPFVGALLCPDHDNSQFHTLWDSARGCHYDHEHGANPFTPQVADAFPGFDLHALLGGVGVGHTNLSSPMENTHKHGGFKWQVDVPAPQGCITGFEGAVVGVDAAVIQYHNFGLQSVEFESRIHSTAAMLRQCQPGSADYGYMYVVQFQDYGQRVSPYQGAVLPYPNTPSPAYGAGFGPYISVDCVGSGLPGCRPNRAFIVSRGINANSIWTSKASGTGVRPEGSALFRLLFRTRDTYQVLDSSDLVHPFTWPFLCSADGGATYSAPGCRYNNSTSTIHEIAGEIPASWDNLAGWDTEPEVGRVTAEGYVTQFGQLNLGCTEAGADCFPVKLVRAHVGAYSAELSETKVSNPTPADTPERDIYFCNGVLCTETAAGAVSSGWIGENN